MIHKTEKKEIRSRIHKRIRRKLHGTAERPRLCESKRRMQQSVAAEFISPDASP